MNGKVKKN